MNLTNTEVTATIPVTDLKRARSFYAEKLGLREIGTVMPDGKHGEVVFEVGKNNHVCIYERPTPSGSTATTCSFEVNDVDATVKDLKDKGVRFEEYDIPAMGIKTKNGIATTGEFKSAWFKDPDGNILAVGNGLANLRRGVKGQPMTKTA